MILGLLGAITGYVTELTRSDNRYSKQTQANLLARGYELVGSEYKEVKTKYMVNQYVKIKKHNVIPDDYILKISGKRGCFAGRANYVVFYNGKEHVITEENIVEN